MTHGIVSIELLADGGRISVNKELIKQRLAVPAEESYDSKVSNTISGSGKSLQSVIAYKVFFMTTGPKCIGR